MKDMIEIGGVLKHRNNSLGKPIHHTEEGIVNFHRWFGDSTAIDELGRPIVYYHGAGVKGIDEFKPTESLRGTFMGGNRPVKSKAFFFTKDRDMAWDFANNRAEHHKYNGLTYDIRSKAHSNVIPVYLKTKNTLDLSGSPSSSMTKLKKLGVDVSKVSFIQDKPSINDLYEVLDDDDSVDKIKNHYDSVLLKENIKKGGRSVAVLDSNSIKHVSNNGFFNNSSKIMENLDFNKFLSDEILNESRIASIKEQNKQIPSEIIDHYNTHGLPNDKKHLDWLIKQHKLGNITPDKAPEMKDVIDTYERHKSVIGKGISAFDVNGLKEVTAPYMNNLTKKQKLESDTLTVHDDDDDFKIQIHKTHRSAALAASLFKNNRYYDKLKKAKWCVSVDGNEGSGGEAYGIVNFNHYTKKGAVDLYSILNKKTGDKSAMIHYKDEPLNHTQFQNELDHRVASSPSDYAGFFLNNKGFGKTELGKQLLERPELKNILDKIPKNPSDSYISNALETEGDLKHAIIQHPNVEEHHIDKMLNNENDTISALRSANIKPHQITRILENNPSNRVLSKLAVHPNLDESHLKTLLTIGHGRVIDHTLLHPNMTDDIRESPDENLQVNMLCHIYDDFSNDDKISLAKSDVIDKYPKLLKRIIHGNYGTAISSLVNNENAHLSDDDMSDIIKNPVADMAIYDLLSHKNIKPHHFDEIYSNGTHNNVLAGHPNTPLKILKDMATSNDTRISKIAQSRL